MNSMECLTDLTENLHNISVRHTSLLSKLLLCSESGSVNVWWLAANEYNVAFFSQVKVT